MFRGLYNQSWWPKFPYKSYIYYNNCIRFQMKVWSSQWWLQFKQLQINPKNIFRTLMGFEPIACTLALQCFTNLAMKIHALIGSNLICWVHLNPWMEWNDEDDVNCALVMKKPSLYLKCLTFFVGPLPFLGSCYTQTWKNTENVDYL